MDNVLEQKLEDQKTLEVIHNLINESTNKEENEFLDSLPSNNGVEESTEETQEEPVEETAKVDIDPNTGVYKQAANKLDISEEMAKMLEFTEEDLIKIPESKYDIEFDEEVIKKNIMESIGAKDQEIVSQILDLVLEYRRADKMRPAINWYDKLPKKIKEGIDKMCLSLNNTAMSTKKMFAAEFIEEIISSSSIDQISIDMQESLSKAFDTSGIMTYFIEENMTTFEKKLEELIEKDKAIEIKDDPEMEEKRQKHIDLLTKIKDQYRQAYTLEGFIEALEKRKVRVKPFDIRKYKRFLDQFYWKYEQDTPFTIQDPSRIPPILMRKFPKFDGDQCKAFVIAFFKYTMNMSANSVVDHTYMSYFISNILQLDLVSHLVEEGDFLNILSNSIERALCAVNNIEYHEESEE